MKDTRSLQTVVVVRLRVVRPVQVLHGQQVRHVPVQTVIRPNGNRLPHLIRAALMFASSVNVALHLNVNGIVQMLMQAVLLAEMNVVMENIKNVHLHVRR